MKMEAFIHSLPKVELHAHINGSVSQKTMNKLINERSSNVSSKNIEEWSRDTDVGKTRSMDQYFLLFKVIHELVDNKAALQQVTLDVVAEFAADNVKYLELRTTPRELKGITRECYIETIVQSLEEADKIHGGAIITRLLLSIDRGKHTEADAFEIVHLADKFRRSSHGRIIGVDLSGNPLVGDARLYLPAMVEAKRLRLKLALHTAEVEGQNEETAALVSLPADRLGHATFVQPHRGGSNVIMDAVDRFKTPIELCLTSNVLSQTVSDYTQHHFGFWYKRKHPCIICTDDKGIFSTSLSQEYAHAQRAFDLSRDDLWHISYAAIDCIFESDDIKEGLRKHWRTWQKENCI